MNLVKSVKLTGYGARRIDGAKTGFRRSGTMQCHMKAKKFYEYFCFYPNLGGSKIYYRFLIPNFNSYTFASKVKVTTERLICQAQQNTCT